MSKGARRTRYRSESMAAGIVAGALLALLLRIGGQYLRTKNKAGGLKWCHLITRKLEDRLGTHIGKKQPADERGDGLVA